MALPMPPEAPVTTAVRFESANIQWFLQLLKDSLNIAGRLRVKDFYVAINALS